MGAPTADQQDQDENQPAQTSLRSGTGKSALAKGAAPGRDTAPPPGATNAQDAAATTNLTDRAAAASATARCSARAHLL